MLLIVHSGLLAYSAYVHSPTLNEPGHLVAGLSHWRFGRFEVYRVNPPLVKMVAALPVMAVGYEEDWSSFYEGPGARPEMAMGEDFVAANGERSFFLFMIARWACIPFSWIGAITCYLWARDLYGRPAGLLACALWCFEPNILAHAALMTPDIGGTALGVAACYTFWKWLRTPTWTQAALTGVVLGLAELCKTTLILFYPLWPLMWVVYRLAERGTGDRGGGTGQEALTSAQQPVPSDSSPVPNSQPPSPSPLTSAQQLAPSASSPASSLQPLTSTPWLREAAMLLLRMTIGLYILNLGYAFEGTGTQLKDFHFVSDLFRGEGTGDGGQGTEKGGRGKGDSLASYLQPLASIPVPLPKNYLLGIDIQQRDFEDYGRPSYLRGEWRDTGWWYYYLYAALIKVPLGLWALGLLALLLPFVNTPPHCEGAAKGKVLTHTSQPAPQNSLRPPSPVPRPPWRDTFILLTPAVVIFTVASFKCGFSEHFRYVLPCFPFVFIWIGRIGASYQALGASQNEVFSD